MKKLSHEEIAALVRRVQNGDQEAFALLYFATVQRQLYFATAFLKDSALAEDAVQEVYLSVYRSLPKLKEPRTFVAYLNRITYNTCVDFKRKQNKEKYQLNEDALLQLADQNPTSYPAYSYDYREDSNALYSAIGNLPEHQKSAFLLRYYHNMKIKDIAATMNVSESTVKRYVKSATKTLSQSL